MSRRTTRRAIPAAIIFALAPAIAGQTPQQPTFRSGVELVQVDVVVVDKDGKHVRGLKAADFAVLDREKPQTIATFEEVSHERPPEAAPVPLLTRPARLDVGNNQTARSDRLVVMVVDDLHIYKGRTERAQDIAREIVSRLGPQASMAVLFTSANRNTQVTEDRAELLAAIDTLRGRQSVRRPHQARDGQKAPAGDPEQDALARLDAIGKAQEVSLQQFFDNLTQYKTLEDAARILGSDDARRKAFVLVSEGIGKDLTGLFDRELSPCEAKCPTCPCFHDHALAEMMESLRRSSVTTYAIDPRGHVSPQDLALEAFPAPPGLGDDPATGGFRWNNSIRQAQDGLTIMAEATGGFAVTDTDDYTSGLHRIIEDLDHYYLLGFYPSNPGRTTGFLAGLARAAGSGSDYRPLDVKVRDHPDWTVRFRKGYRPGGPPAAPRNKDPLVALAAGVLPKTDLPLRLYATVFPGERKLATVAAAIEVTAPTKVLLGPDAKLHDEVSYGVLVVDEKKTKVTSRTNVAARIALKPRISVRSPEDDPNMPGLVSYQIPLTLELPPGTYQLRASATSTKLARGGSVYLTIEVPDFAKEALTIAGMTLGYGDGDHVAVADLPKQAPRRDARAPFAPSLDRTFTPADTLRLYFELARGSPTTVARTKVEILDEHDDVRAWVDRQIPANDRGHVDIRLPLSTLAPGAYRLRVTADDGANSAAREVGIVIK
jgi:VWFA-related protein